MEQQVAGAGRGTASPSSCTKSINTNIYKKKYRVITTHSLCGTAREGDVVSDLRLEKETQEENARCI